LTKKKEARIVMVIHQELSVFNRKHSDWE